VTSGFVDLGTAADPGGNTVNVNGAGNFFLNTTATPITAVGTAFAVNGTLLPPAAETQPAGMVDGRDTVGTVNGLPAGGASANDVFSGVVLQAGAVAENYNFGERPAAGGGSRQTAAIGFWQNKKGQDLIRS
jgi:hypothetical protein